jgi:peptidoglycan/xylan/chitin deacetylase (PgdA/CDA1 family)
MSINRLERLCFKFALALSAVLVCFIAGASQPTHATSLSFPDTPAVPPAFARPLPTASEYLPIVPDYKFPPVKSGLAPVLTRIPTKHPVVFLGIDDGVYRKPFELELMKTYHIRASLFLTDSAIFSDPAFFKPFIKAGSLVEDHTVSHGLMSDLTYEQQKKEICREADKQQKQFGRRPVLFRPPGGDYNLSTRRAAADCGMKAIVTWVAKANGGSMQYQTGVRLHPGDIVLMHFRPEFKDDMNAFIEAQQASGLRTDLLENWLPKHK